MSTPASLPAPGPAATTGGGAGSGSDAVPIGMVTVDDRGVVTAWNEQAAQLLGWPPAGAIGRSLAQLLPASGLVDDIAVVASTGRTRVVEYDVHGPDGHRRTLHAFLTPDGGPEARRVSCLITEVTGTPDGTGGWARDVIERSPAGVALIGRDGTLTYVNPALAELLGTTPAGLERAPALGLVHPVDRDGVSALLEPPDGSAAPAAVHLVTARGDRIPVTLTPSRVDVAGWPHVVWQVEDRRPVVAADERARRADDRYDALIQHGSDLVALVDRDGTVRYASPSLGRILGYEPTALVGTAGAIPVHPDDEEALGRVLAPRSAQASEAVVLRVARADGAWRHLEVVGADLHDNPAVGGILLTARDITERIEAVDEARRSEERYRALVDALAEVVFATDVNGRWSFLNPAWAELSGVDPARCVGRPVLEFVHPTDRDAVEEAMWALLGGHETSRVGALRMLAGDGSSRRVEVSVRAVTDAAGQVTGLTGSMTDVTDRHRTDTLLTGQARILGRIARGDDITETLDTLTELVEELIDGAVCSILLMTDDGRSLRLGAAPRLPEEMRRLADGLSVGPSSGAAGTAAYRGAPVVSTDISADPRWDGLRDAPLAAGLRAAWSLPVTSSASGRVLGTVAVFFDEVRAPGQGEWDMVEMAGRLVAIAVERSRAAAQLSHQALHDPLTGLPNRLLLLDRLEHALARRIRTGRTLALLFLDLDRFKVINDSLGHSVGDDVLVAAAARLVDAMRPGDTVARFGGDEFVVLCEEIDGPDDAAVVADRLAVVLAEPFGLPGGPTSLTASIGIAVASEHHNDPESLLRDADAAMYRAKERGRSRRELFDDDMRARAVGRLRLETALRRAMEAGDITVVYQPKVCLATGVIVGMEALARWTDPELGEVTPAEFVPVAEETGLIVDVGRHVLTEACHQLARWRDQGHTLTMAVNLSARQVVDARLPEQITALLGDARCAAEDLVLEITESTVMEDVAAAISSLRALKDVGVQLAIDDFGTGYSSLSYLHRFPVDVVKVDQSFVGALDARGRDAAIVTAVLGMAAALGLHTVAEGVETPAQLAELRRLGCRSAQGFLFSPPLDPAAMSHLLERHPVW